MIFQNGNITASFDDYYFTSVSMPHRPANGFVAIGTDNFGLVDFDNLVIDNAKWEINSASHQQNLFISQYFKKKKKCKFETFILF